jgi:hypothetical protein
MRSFSESAARVEAKMEKVRQEVVDLTLDMRRDLQRGNPVKFGRSSASWNVSTPAASRHRQPASYYNVTESRFLDAKTNVGRFKLGWVLHVSNLQDYIQILENTHVAAAGWVRRTRDLYGAKIKQRLKAVMG